MTYTTAVEMENWPSLQYHEFCLAFPEMPSDRYEELKKDILGLGLRRAIILYEGKILDGRHRHRACLEGGVDPHFEEFTGPGSAYDFVISENLKRRDLTPAQHLDVRTKLIDIMRRRAKERQGARSDLKGKNIPVNLPESADGNVVQFPSGDVRDELAKQVGVSPKTASDFITIKERGTEEDVRAVVDGRASISGKANEVRERERVERAKPKQAEYITLPAWEKMATSERALALSVVGHTKLNEQDNESIGWAKWSWNPVTGCKHNCPYCYARDIANRFYEQGFEPSLIPSRLAAPQNQKPRAAAATDPAEKNIFTCSMADLFGRWVPDDWINAVMRSVERSPEWDFLFLTKFPKRMVDREVPKNVWLGTSVDLQARVSAVENAFERVQANTRWLSIEPLIEPLTFKRPDLFRWVVIGGASSSSETPVWQPPFEWVARLYLTFKEAGASVYIKDNIGFNGPTRPKEYPWRDPELKSAPDVFRYLKREK
jgi:protein gp37